MYSDFNESINAQFNSNISYTKTFKGSPFNLSANLRHSQNVQTKKVNLTLPDVSYNMSRIYPFKNLGKPSQFKSINLPGTLGLSPLPITRLTCP